MLSFRPLLPRVAVAILLLTAVACSGSKKHSSALPSTASTTSTTASVTTVTTGGPSTTSPPTTAAAATATSKAPHKGGPTTTRPSPVRATNISIQNLAFSPPNFEVKAGKIITVLNNDTDTQHTLTADNGSFDVGPIEARVTEVFVAPRQLGTYSYHCRIHPSMHGTIVVVAG